MCKKMKGQLVHSPTRIDSFLLLQSPKLLWGSLLLPLFDFEQVLWSRLNWVWSPLSTINRSRVANWLRSPPNAIAWIEWCFLAFLGSWGIIFMLASQLHVQSHRPPTVPFPFLCMGNGRFTFVWTGQNGTKMSPLWLLLYESCFHMYCMYA